jgi:shikimate dehydrogenase
MSITASTRVLVLLGDPVGHSLSPVIQNAACAEAGMDGVYVAVRCAEDDLMGVMKGLSSAGGGGNITLPHKE